jgi:hypothetical protein
MRYTSTVKKLCNPYVCIYPNLYGGIRKKAEGPTFLYGRHMHTMHRSGDRSAARRLEVNSLIALLQYIPRAL